MYDFLLPYEKGRLVSDKKQTSQNVNLTKWIFLRKGVSMPSIENEIFSRRRIIFSSLEPNGFTKEKDHYVLERAFMEGQFILRLTISLQGEVHFKVFDTMNNEEYAQLYNPRFKGTYVSSVRHAYRQLLHQIGDTICEDQYFTSDQANRMTQMIFQTYKVKPDFPFKATKFNPTGVFRHAESKKWFALIINANVNTLLNNGDQTSIDIINLKTNQSQELREKFPSTIYPAYHMNHKTWISIILNDSINDEILMDLIHTSFRLTSR